MNQYCDVDNVQKDLTLSQVKKICKLYDIKPTEIDFDDYLILTDEEANESVAERIQDDLWALYL